MTWLVEIWQESLGNGPMDSVQVGKAVFVKEKLHNPGKHYEYKTSRKLLKCFSHLATILHSPTTASESTIGFSPLSFKHQTLTLSSNASLTLIFDLLERNLLWLWQEEVHHHWPVFASLVLHLVGRKFNYGLSSNLQKINHKFTLAASTFQPTSPAAVPENNNMIFLEHVTIVKNYVRIQTYIYFLWRKSWNKLVDLGKWCHAC